MIKVLIWQVSNDTSLRDKAIKILKQQHNGIEIVDSATGKDIVEIAGDKDYDVLLAIGAIKRGLSQLTKDISYLNASNANPSADNDSSFHLSEEKLLCDWIVCIPGFTLDKYRRLQRSRLSILSVNCIGGLLSHKMGLPFRSPFVNLFLSNGDFLKFLGKPHEYLAEKLIHKGQKLNSTSAIEYPVISLGDISLHMLHYKTFEEAAEAWERRKERINWYNLFVVMWTTKIEELEQFDALPYGKKVCFVPFKSDLDSAWYIEHQLKKRYPLYVHFINETAKGNPFFYDPFDMLLYGKKTPLIDV